MAAGVDTVLGFTIPARAVRGRLVRLGPVVDEILATHAYAGPVARLLGEALALAAVLGSLLRPDDGELTLQARGDSGPVKLLVADFRQHALRGYAALDLDRRFAGASDQPENLQSLFGQGYLVLTLDQSASAERYQGIVELGQTTLQAAAQTYFENSEQLPSLVRLAAAQGPDGRWRAGGLILQHVSRTEEGQQRLHVDEAMVDPDWEHAAVLAASTTTGELLDPGVSHEELLWRLFHGDEVRVLPAEKLLRGCRCSVDHIRQVLQQFPEDERTEMRDSTGLIRVDCEFCAKQFPIDI